MEQELYGDVFFLINFAMDFIALYITGKFTKTKLKVLRTSFAAALGGVYSVAALFVEIASPFNWLLMLLVSFLICTVAQKAQNLSEILKFWGVFMVSSGMIGGIMSALFSVAAKFSDGKISAVNDTYNRISFWLFSLITALSFVLAAVTIRISSGSVPKGSVSVMITEGKSSVVFELIADSGNFLRDPISGKAALIVSIDAVKKVLPEKITEVAAKDLISNLPHLPGVLARKVRLLPAGTIFGSGIIMGYIPDKITIIKGKKEKNIEAILALVKGDYIKKGYGGIVPPELI